LSACSELWPSQNSGLLVERGPGLLVAAKNSQTGGLALDLDFSIAPLGRKVSDDHTPANSEYFVTGACRGPLSSVMCFRVNPKKGTSLIELLSELSGCSQKNISFTSQVYNLRHALQ
jgi:hypothetical protein